jgi:secreted trypsin-like serine protease
VREIGAEELFTKLKSNPESTCGNTVCIFVKVADNIIHKHNLQVNTFFVIVCSLFISLIIKNSLGEGKNSTFTFVLCIFYKCVIF